MPRLLFREPLVKDAMLGLPLEYAKDIQRGALRDDADLTNTNGRQVSWRSEAVEISRPDIPANAAH